MVAVKAQKVADVAVLKDAARPEERLAISPIPF